MRRLSSARGNTNSATSTTSGSKPRAIEAFVGKRVHEALEKLYRDLKFTKLCSREEILGFYEEAWEKNWHNKIQVVRPD